MTFWNGSLCCFYEKFKNFWIVHNFSTFSADFTKHKISFLILEWVMKSSLWGISETLNEWFDFIHLSIWILAHWLSSHWINHGSIRVGSNPFSSNKVHTFVVSGKIIWIDGSESFQVLAEASLGIKGYAESTTEREGFRQHFI